MPADHVSSLYKHNIVCKVNLSCCFCFSDPQIRDFYASIAENCTPYHCRQECLRLVRQVKKNNPCYRGNAYAFAKYAMVFWDDTQRNSTVWFYEHLDSCDYELWKEGLNDDGVFGGITGGVARNCISYFLFVASFLVVLFK